MRPNETRRTPGDADGPAAYVIVIQGVIDDAWLGRLNDLQPSTRDERSGPVTELRGVLADQAALAGVLKTLYELGLPLISVDRQTE